MGFQIFPTPTGIAGRVISLARDLTKIKSPASVTFNPSTPTTYTVGLTQLVAETVTIGANAIVRVSDYYPIICICKTLYLYGTIAAYRTAGGGQTNFGAGAGGNGGTMAIIFAEKIIGNGVIDASGRDGGAGTAYTSGYATSGSAGISGCIGMLPLPSGGEGGSYGNLFGGDGGSGGTEYIFSCIGLNFPFDFLPITLYNDKARLTIYAGGGGGGAADWSTSGYAAPGGGGGGGIYGSGGKGGNTNTSSSYMGAAGGGGGGGGYVLLVSLSPVPAITIKANGGNGGSGYGPHGGGGGGGGGGLVAIFAPSHNATVNVSGGLGGSAGGSAGSAGVSGGNGVMVYYAISV